jgi:transcriptional regulator with XRE-family HTH domain
MSEDVRQILGSNVRRLRKGAGLSQAELANRMGVDRAYVSGLELGQRNPTIVTLWHLGQALKSDLGEFFAQRPTRSGRSAPAKGAARKI